MAQVRLTAKTKYAKDRIARHGEIWNVLLQETWEGKECLRLESLERTFSLGPNALHIRDIRRVLVNNDKDFMIEQLK